MKYERLKINKEPIKDLMSDIAIEGYKSPIELVIGQMRMAQENGIFKAVQEQGVIVDKDELIKALRYDRGQYDEGYCNGYLAGLNANKWISVKDEMPERNGRYLTHCLIEGQSLVCILHYSKVGGFNESTVTHWQYLPEPPEERGEEE